MNALAFLDPVQTSILSPLPVASCRSRDPVRRLWRVLQGREAAQRTLAGLAKGARVASEQHETRRVEGKAPAAPSREEASDFAFKDAAEGVITAFAFKAEVHRKTNITPDSHP